MTREEALKAITAFVENYACGSDLDGLREAIEALQDRTHGEWMPLGEPDDLGIHSWYICSRCGFRTTWHMVDIFHFCPNCGADMRKKESARNDG